MNYEFNPFTGSLDFVGSKQRYYQAQLSGLRIEINKASHGLNEVYGVAVYNQSGNSVSVQFSRLDGLVVIESNVDLSGHIAIISGV